jgi:uncharacterized damage-inducible protein DinB
VYQNEYEWVRQTRGVLLDFCRDLQPNDFTRPMGFGWQSVRDTLVHIAAVISPGSAHLFY